MKRQFISRLVIGAAVLAASLLNSGSSSAQVSGLVYKDYNANGTRDSAAALIEPRLAGITVTAYDSTGAVLATTTSAANGTYSFTAVQIPAGRPVRVEFTGLASYDFPGVSGGTSVQFVTAGAAANAVNFAVNNPDDYCQNNPMVIVPHNYIGPATGANNTLEGIYYNTASSTATSAFTGFSTNAATGTTYGMAYSKKTKTIFNSAVVRNYFGTGPGGFDAIYTFNFNDPLDDGGAAATLTAGTTIDLGTLGVAVGTDPRTGPITGTNPYTDNATLYQKVGKIGIGDIDINANGDTLYAVNMKDGAPTLAILNVANSSSPSLIADVAIPDPGCIGGVFRPWAVKVYQGKPYIGGVCDASSGTAVNLTAYVYRYDGGSTFTQIASMPLNYTRGKTTFRADGTNTSANWQKWTDTWAPQTLPLSPATIASQPQPMLTDIEFAEDGSMILAFGDRFTYQNAQTQRQYGVTSGAAYFTTPGGGDIIKFCNIGGTLIQEASTGSCLQTNTDNGSVTTSNPINSPTGIKEFFDDDYYNTGSSSTGQAGHSETSLGALAILPGRNQVVASAFDPVTTVAPGGSSGPINSSGLRTYNSTNGNYVKGWVAVTETDPGANRKGGNMGDVEILCNAAPIEIGNRVWLDNNKNGIQDPGEPGIPGVLLELVDASGNAVDSDPATAGVQPTTVTTDANGNWIISNAKGTDATGKNFGVSLLDNTNYRVRVATTGTGNDWDPTANGGIGGPRPASDLANLTLTTSNATGTGAPDLSDNDATFVSSVPEISFTTGIIGANNHTYDMGFYRPYGSLGNYVWYDMNGDGLQNEPDSSGINGQKVYLYDGITNVLLDSTITMNDTAGKPGYYLFDSLSTGTFYVKFPSTIGAAKLTTPNTAVATNGNSDANFTTGQSPNVVINPFKTGVDKDNMTIDAGYRPMGSLGNYVWYDDNGNGLQDEPTSNGINGEKVYLLNGDTDAIIDSAITANNPTTGQPGYYLFDSLATGNYKVKFPTTVGSSFVTTATTTPATDNNSDANSTTGVSPNVFINALGTGVAKDNMTIDAGYLTLGTIGNYVWLDSNKNGFNDEAATAGINGVTVQLKDNATGLIIETTTTANNPIGGQPGYYIFDSLKKGSYTVVFPASVSTNTLTTQTSSAGTDNVSDPNTTTGESPAVALDPKLGGINQNNPTIDAGYVAPAPTVFGSLGNYVWYDDNGNGIQDEPASNGVNGVLVTLLQETSPGVYSSIGTRTTANNPQTNAPGYYLFDNLSSGNYKVQFPATVNGFGLTNVVNQAATTDNNNDADAAGLSGVVNINTAGTGLQVDNPTIDAGYLPLGTIGNYVWKDDNGDGINNEPPANGINGVKVYLKTPLGVIVDSATTGPDPISGNPGYYLIDSVKKGDYVLEFPKTSGGNDLTPSPGLPGDNFSKPNSSTGITPQISMDPKAGGTSKDNPNQDAGYAPKGSLGNYVWYDDNRDGANNEPASNGINGVVVKLIDAATGLVIATDTTANDLSGNPGYYSFEKLGNGNYIVQFPKELDNGAIITPVINNSATIDNNNNAEATNGLTDTVNINVVGSGLAKDNPTIDAGYWRPASIGNRVWLDANKDGLQTPGEVGVSGVTVTLFNDNYDIVGSTITDAYGNYKFEQLIPGDYAVTFTPPTNYVVTKYDPAGDNQNDNNSDADTAYGFFYATTPLYTLVGGEYDSTVDCGIYLATPKTAVVGDYVWYDADSNGTQDPTEKGISGVPVQLVDGTGKVVAATVTDATGKYLFTNVTPGNGYTVKFGQPIGYEPTTQSGGYNVANNSDANPTTLTTAPFNVLPGDSIPTLDAGFVKADPNKAALGNRVWYDNDNDGIQDAGETGVANVKVYLKDATNTIIDSTQTDALGQYIFNNLDAGVYSVLFAPASLPAGYTFTSQNSGTDDELDGDESPVGQTGTYTLAAGDRNMSVDAGVVNLANNNSLGDYVWLDANKDGIQDPTEAGVSGVTVTLYNNVGVALASTTTDATGKYRFNGLPNGTYSVGFSNLPEAMGFTTSNAGTNDSLDSDVNPSSGKTPSVTLTGGQHNPTLDAGIYPQGKPSFTGTLGDVVWYDLNNNGVQEFGEVGVSDVVVTLFDLGPDGVKGTPDDGPSKFMYTDIQGNYLFTNLPASNYQVAFSDLPVGYTTSPQNATNSRDDSNVPAGFTSTGVTDTVFAPVVALGPGEDNLTIDAGIYKPNVNSIGNYVWYDVNKDGIQDPTEQGVFGTEVLLLNPDGSLFDRDPLEAGIQPYVEITYNDGSYLFTNLPNGSYKVQIVNLDAGYVLTQANAGANDSLDSDGDPVTFTSQVVTVTGGQFNPTLDFGIYSDTRAALGNYVWIDSNRDGLQDPNETPVPGVLVTLFDASGTPLATAVTDGTGKYLFNNLAAGTYSVGFTNIPDGTEFTIQDVDVVIGSDANPLTGKSGALALAPGTVNLTLDAGLTPIRKGGLGNYVWYDDNQNGLQDATEKGVPGVTVTVTEAASGQVVGVASTDANGYYLFPNLDPDKQYIAVFSDIPAEYVFTANNGVVGDAANSDADVTSGATTPATVPVNNINPNVDAGIYLPLGSIGNYVWYDDDGDGSQNEPDTNGINGVNVYLYKDIAGTFTLVDSVTTMNDPITNKPGYYLFDSLRRGNYQVQFPTSVNGAALTLQDSTAQTEGNSDASASDGKSGIILLEPKLGGINQVNPTIDAGYLPLGSLGNYVWNDDNGNGLLDEPTANGINGVTVYLKDNTGTIIDSAVTGNNPITSEPGYYLFDSLKKGDYTVIFPTTNDGNGLTTATTTAATDSNSDANATTGESPVVSLDPKKGGIDQNNMTIDAGYLPLGTIGNYVWNDDNGNGLLDEPTTNGINGVTVYLTDGTGTIIDSAVTGNNPITSQPGYYLFDSLKKGDYTVIFPTTNDGNGLTTATTTAATDSNSDANATTGESPVVSLDPKLGGINKDNMTIDAGYLPLGSIGNYVWNDDNGNGLLDEPTTNGINGVTVYLKDGTGTIIDSAVTANNPITSQPGYYLFDSLKKGDYTVVFPTNINGNPLTTPTTTAAADSNSDANTTTGESPVVSLDPKLGGINKDNPTVDAGYIAYGSIGNYVWYDDNADGIQNEPVSNGINGVTVYLLKDNGSGFVIVDSMVTANNPTTANPGYYLFDSLSSGSYRVLFPVEVFGTDLTTTTVGFNNDSTSDANQATGETNTITINVFDFGTSKNNPTIDAGYVPLGSLGNRVWVDSNENGLYDEDSTAGINGVQVILLKENEFGVFVPIDSMVTVTDTAGKPGYYLFDRLPNGNYKVQFPPSGPGGLVLTGSTPTSQVDSNSDADSLTGLSPVITIINKGGGFNEKNPTIDAGYRPQAALAVGDIVLTATRLEKSDKLTWTLLGQDDYVSYEVYVGNALTNMHQISSLPANSANQYMFNNLDIASGILYYQVVGIDAAGKLKYSNTVNISRDRIYSVDVYPNPTTGNTAVHFGTALTEATAISVYDVSGKLVQQGVANIGTKVYNLDLSQLSSGIYTVTVGRSTHRVTKD
ncbi:MAG: hypothetical protein RL660_2 [Bacteroidota bacterium]